MSAILISVTVLAALLLALVSLVQMLYLESLRLRTRELPALEHFKETLEDRLGLETEKGAVAFSLIKHLLMMVTALAMCGVMARGAPLTWASLLEAALFSAAILLASAYVVPQLLYRKTGGEWLSPLVPGFKLLALAVRPMTAFFGFLQTLASLSDSAEKAEENGSASEDLDALIEAGADEGLIEEGDRKLIHSVVALGDKTVREVMTPRPNVVAIQQDASVEDFRALAVENHFSRVPVCNDSIDNIVGFVHVRDMVKLDYEDREHRKVKELVRPTMFVPETKRVADLFREMQRDNVQMAIVVDEYGETAGIVTMEDVVEEVFGEIHDEHDWPADVEQESDGVYLVAGHVDLDRLHDLLEFRPDEQTESTTVGGLVTEWLGHVPQVSETVDRDGIRIEVTASDERHVQQVRVSRVVGEEEGKENARNGE